jgi:hypothetical protein
LSVATGPGPDQKIKEAVVICSRCQKPVPGTQAIRATQHFIVIDHNGIPTDIGPATLCEVCLNQLGGPN